MAILYGNAVTINTDDNSSAASSPWRTIGLAAVLVLAIFVAYLPSMNGGFVCDDSVDVANNEALHSWDGLYAIWTQPGATAQYYPLTFTTFWLNYQLGGLNPLGYHMANVLLHAMNALLLWWILRKLAIPGAWLAAGIFALHPVNVESVAYIDERKNVLSGFFFFCTLLAAIKFWLPHESKSEARAKTDNRQPGTEGGQRTQDSGYEKEGLSKITESQAFIALKHKALCLCASVVNFADWKWYGLTFVLYFCALLSKTAVLSLPAVILLMIWWRRRPTLRDVTFLIPLALAGVVMGLITMRLENHLVALTQHEELSWLQRCLLAPHDVWFYLGKLIWPHPLMFTYPHWEFRASDWKAYAPGLALAVGLGILWRKRAGWGRPCLFALVYFVVLLFLTLGFFNINYFRFSFVADHFQYLACIGPFILFGAGVMRAASRWGRPSAVMVVPWITAAVLLLPLSVLSWQQNGMYVNSETLWRTNLAQNPGCARAMNNLGDCLIRQNHVDQAAELYRRALKLDPGLREAVNNLAEVLRQSERYADAIAIYEASLKSNPDDALALNDLAWLLATCPDSKYRDGPRSVNLAEQACRMTGYQYPVFVGTLAAANAEANQFFSAKLYANMAEQVATDQGQPSVAEKNQQLSEHYYQLGKAYHEPAAKAK